MRLLSMSIIMSVVLFIYFAPFAHNEDLLPMEESVPEVQAIDIYNTNHDMLDMVAQLLWENPQFFTRILGENEYTAQYSSTELLAAGFDHAGISDADWQAICAVINQTGIAYIEFYSQFSETVTAFLFGFHDTPHSANGLVYIRTRNHLSTEQQSEAIDIMYQYMCQGPRSLKSTSSPYWYQYHRSSLY